MDAELAWDECVDDIPLDTKNLPPLNALSSNSTNCLPDIDLLDLFSFDQNITTQNNQQINQTDIRSPRHDMHHHPQLQNPKLSTAPSLPPAMTDVDGTISPVTSASPAPSSPGAASSSTQSGRDSSNSSDIDTETSDPTHKQQILQQSHQLTPPSTTCSSPKANTYESSKSQQQQPEMTDQAQLVLELSTRLGSAGSEATALRKRVGLLTSENRSLRAALDHANARLLAVAQAATATAQPSTTQPLMLGLAHVTADVASRLGGVLTVSDPHATNINNTNNTHSCSSLGGVMEQHHHQHHQPQQPHQRGSKKRKRVSGAAATTMACVMFMWGALVGSPGWLSSSGNSTSRSQAALPAVWKGSEGQNTAVANVGGAKNQEPVEQAWQPNCMRVLEPLPDGSEHTNLKKSKKEPLLAVGGNGASSSDDDDGDPEMDEDGDQNMAGNTVGRSSFTGVPSKENVKEEVVATGNEMFVDVVDNKATAKMVATADHHHNGGSNIDNRLPRYSYVLCRDTQVAMDNVKACTNRMKDGLPCGEPHTISLILPASAAGLDEMDSNDTDGSRRPSHADLAEVQCSITSVARIPVGGGATAATNGGHESSGDGNRSEGGGHARYGRVIATVVETGTAIIG